MRWFHSALIFAQLPQASIAFLPRGASADQLHGSDEVSNLDLMGASVCPSISFGLQ